jgi:hypothetical protein
MDRKDLALAALVAVEGAHAYSAALPSIMTIRTFAKEEEQIKSIRHGEIYATVWLAVFAFLVSVLMGSPLPMLFAFVTAASMIGMYEWALRRP